MPRQVASWVYLNIAKKKQAFLRPPHPLAALLILSQQHNNTILFANFSSPNLRIKKISLSEFCHRLKQTNSWCRAE